RRICHQPAVGFEVNDRWKEELGAGGERRECAVANDEAIASCDDGAFSVRREAGAGDVVAPLSLQLSRGGIPANQAPGVRSDDLVAILEGLHFADEFRDRQFDRVRRGNRRGWQRREWQWWQRGGHQKVPEA